VLGLGELPGRRERVPQPAAADRRRVQAAHPERQARAVRRPSQHHPEQHLDVLGVRRLPTQEFGRIEERVDELEHAAGLIEPAHPEREPPRVRIAVQDDTVHVGHERGHRVRRGQEARQAVEFIGVDEDVEEVVPRPARLQLRQVEVPALGVRIAVEERSVEDGEEVRVRQVLVPEFERVEERLDHLDDGPGLVDLVHPELQAPRVRGPTLDEVVQAGDELLGFRLGDGSGHDQVERGRLVQRAPRDRDEARAFRGRAGRVDGELSRAARVRTARADHRRGPRGKTRHRERHLLRRARGPRHHHRGAPRCSSRHRDRGRVVQRVVEGWLSLEEGGHRRATTAGVAHQARVSGLALAAASPARKGPPRIRRRGEHQIRVESGAARRPAVDAARRTRHPSLSGL